MECVTTRFRLKRCRRLVAHSQGSRKTCNFIKVLCNPQLSELETPTATKAEKFESPRRSKDKAS